MLRLHPLTTWRTFEHHTLYKDASMTTSGVTGMLELFEAFAADDKAATQPSLSGRRQKQSKNAITA